MAPQHMTPSQASNARDLPSIQTQALYITGGHSTATASKPKTMHGTTQIRHIFFPLPITVLYRGAFSASKICRT